MGEVLRSRLLFGKMKLNHCLEPCKSFIGLEVEGWGQNKTGRSYNLRVAVVDDNKGRFLVIIEKKKRR